MLYLLGDKEEQALIDYSSTGGSLVISYFSAISNEVDTIKLGGYGGKLVRDHLGVFVDEFAPVRQGEPVTLSNGLAGSEWSEFAKVTTASEVATYSGGVADGCTAIAKASSGRDWYVGTRLDDSSNQEFFSDVALELGLKRLGGQGVEVIRRGAFTFSIDHNSNQVSWARDDQ
jgi:beta-galactosidase